MNAAQGNANYIKVEKPVSSDIAGRRSLVVWSLWFHKLIIKRHSLQTEVGNLRKKILFFSVLLVRHQFLLHELGKF